jgi:hypothetical protein
MILALRRTVFLEGERRPDDYEVRHDGRSVGRIYRMRSTGRAARAGSSLHRLQVRPWCVAIEQVGQSIYRGKRFGSRATGSGCTASASYPSYCPRCPSYAGKDLLCWCAPERCHADVLLELANVPATAQGAHFAGPQDDAGAGK